MKVKVKLFATLTAFAPHGEKAGEPFEVELPEGSDIADLWQALGISEAEIKVSFVNGLARSKYYHLHEGDEVGIFPPIGGG